MSKGVAGVLLVIALAAGATEADAQDDAAPWAEGVSAERRTKALELFDAGNAFYVKRQYKQALEQYEDAIEVWDHPAIRGNIARCLVHLDRPVDAFHNLQSALQYGAAPLDERVYENLLTLEKTLSGSLARLQVEATQDEARILVDGELLLEGKGKAERIVIAGEHNLVATRPAHLTSSRLLTLPPGEVTVLKIELVSLENAGTYERRWDTWKPWAVMGGGAAIALLGVPLQRSARNNADEFERGLNELCPEGCPSSELPGALEDLESRARWQSRASVSMFIVGGATIATGAALLYLNRPRYIPAENPPDPESAAPRIAPVITPDSVGFAIGGVF